MYIFADKQQLCYIHFIHNGIAVHRVPKKVLF
jgi:hypothetical protein